MNSNFSHSFGFSFLSKRFVILTAIISAVTFFSGPVLGQFHLEWARKYSLDPSKTNQAWKIMFAREGVVVGGTSVNAAGDADYVAIKYNAQGEEIWKIRYDSGTEDRLRDMTRDPAGNIFMTGTSATVKVSPDGNLVWAATSAGGRAVVVNANFVYVTGTSSTDFATVQLLNDNAVGAQQWLKTYNGPRNDQDVSTQIVLTPQGEAIVAGWEFALRSKGNLGAIFLDVIKYSENGTQQWFGKANICSLGCPTLMLKVSRWGQGEK
jgi:hypothetical protein